MHTHSSYLAALCLIAAPAAVGAAQVGPASRPPAISAPQASRGDKGEIEEVAPVPIRQGPTAWWGEDYPRIERGINHHLPQVTRRHALLFVVDHRTNKPFTDNTWHDFFGFDAGSLKIGLGLRFGIIQNLDAGVYRLNNATERFDVYEFDAKYQLLHQERHFINLGLRAGITWFSQDGADDAVGGFGQLLVSRLFISRLTLGTGLLYHSDSTNGAKSRFDTNWSMAIPLVFDVRILGWLSWNAEAGFNIAGYGTRDKKDTSGNALSSYPSFSSSARFITARHTFALVVTNNQYVSADGLVSNSPRGFNQLIVGFTITREWNF